MSLEKPYEISLEKRSTDTTILEKALKIIRSCKQKPNFGQKRLTTGNMHVEQLSALTPDGEPITVEELTNILYTPSVVDDVLNAISRPKSEEYPISGSFSESVGLVNRFLKETTCSSCTNHHNNSCMERPGENIIPTCHDALTYPYYSPKHVGGGS